MNFFKRAFIHSSYCKIKNDDNNIIIANRPKNCLPLRSKSNERLEFLGDGVLELITKYYLYTRFPKADEGFMTEKKSPLLKTSILANLRMNSIFKLIILFQNTRKIKKLVIITRNLDVYLKLFLVLCF